jgi:hypothetical protein
MTRPEPVPPAEQLPDPARAMPAAATPMSAASRRAFMAGAGAATVVGAAAVAVGTAGPAAAATATATTVGDASAPQGPAHGAAVVAYVRNAVTGEIRLMSGDREVVVHDRALARTLTRHVDAQES